MENKIKIYKQLAIIGVFLALPLLFYFLGDFPRRSVLKETISLLTILAFFSMLIVFYLSRTNRSFLKEFKMSKINKWHKVLAYIFVSILLVHPFLIVLPRYFEAGISPMEAFKTLITTYSTKGIILGMAAWCLMLILGITSLLRNKLPMSYKSWRLLHGILSSAFIVLASFHVIDMGRHMNIEMTWLIAILSGIGIALLLTTYIFKTSSLKKNE